ncbi:hypothetical protein DV515_00016283 [Chloebia gouldiae]|uniref:Uncharacterized protein n=1 Tax=Chloebia gouldiae TaxID=44316 RepID=A0A3L8RUC3_CHLGU|nr:hypothetical protein DV515_00016283 [Chloebia gouldiae]
MTWRELEQLKAFTAVPTIFLPCTTLQTLGSRSRTRAELLITRKHKRLVPDLLPGHGHKDSSGNNHRSEEKDTKRANTPVWLSQGRSENIN